MGMAASQARWISLAARKTNVEYEGQQINQARTALANKSADLWNELYKMNVPTAPSSEDFTTTQYSFNIGDKSQTISNIQKTKTTIEGIEYNSYVTYYSTVEEYKGIRNTNSNPQVQYVTSEEGNYYMVGTRKLTCLADADQSSDIWKSYSAALDQIGKDWSDTQVAKDWAAKNYSNIYFWTDSEQHVNFASENSSTKDSLRACMGTDYALHSYYSDYESTNKEISKYAIIDYDSSGRASNIQLEGSTATYQLSTSSITDERAYNDAMNKYNYDKQVYEKRVQDINSKTEQIQTEDRTLEIRLKQLDTEQNALQTEMDAVHKVLSKNIDDTFKTFNS